MKKIIITTALLGIASIGFATTTPINAPSGMTGTGALDGLYAYTWTVASGALVSGSSISSASLTFTSIKLTSSGNGNDLNFDLGRVFSGMAAKPSTLPGAGSFGTYTDNDATGDAFAANITSGNAKFLGKQSLTYNVATTWTYTFSSSDLSALNSYASQGSWGFLIDPDCVFNVGGITFNYSTTPNGVPDGGTTAALLGAAMLGLGWAKRRMGVA